MKRICTAVHLGKYDDRFDRSRLLVCPHMIVAIVTIAEAIAGIEPDPIPAIAIAAIANSGVSI